MAFKDISNLPEEVRKALPEPAQHVFLKAHNEATADPGEAGAAMRDQAAWKAVEETFEDHDGRWIEKAGMARTLKVNEELGIVFGFAMVCKIDGIDYYDLNIDPNGERVPENIPEDAMLKCLAVFMAKANRPGNDMHVGEDKGEYIFAFPLTTDIAKSLEVVTRKTGALVGYMPPPELLAKYKSGEYTGFSIEGLKIEWEEDDNG